MTAHIFMTGEAGYHNLGDEGQALASARRLRSYFPGAELVATGLDPRGAVLRHQARIVPWPLSPYDLETSYLSKLTRRVARKLRAPEDFMDPAGRPLEEIFAWQYRCNAQFRSVLAEIEQCDFVFDMGHGAVNDVFDPFTLCFLYYLCGRLGKPLFISGQSMGPLWLRRSIKMVRDTLPCAHTVGLRDKGVSHRVLVDHIGLDPASVRLVEVGDDTLDLVPREPVWRKFPQHVADLLRHGDFFAVQWRLTDYSRQFTATQQLVPLANAIKHLNQESRLPAVFVPLSWELNGDVLAATRLHDYLGDEIPLHVIWNHLDVAEVKWLLGRARFGVGPSYHFNVFLLSQGVPTIGVYSNTYYDVKLHGAFAAFDYSEEPLPYPNGVSVTAPGFQAAESRVLNWTDNDRARLQRTAEAQRRKWHTAFRSFLQDVGYGTEVDSCEL